MEQVMFTILTDEQVRDDDAMEVCLDREFSVGAEWSYRLLLDASNSQ